MNFSAQKCSITSKSVTCIKTFNLPLFLLETGILMHQAAQQCPPSRGSCEYVLQALHSVTDTTLSHITADAVVASNIFREVTLPSVSLKDERDSWCLWVCRGVELFQIENYC